MEILPWLSDIWMQIGAVLIEKGLSILDTIAKFIGFLVDVVMVYYILWVNVVVWFFNQLFGSVQLLLDAAAWFFNFCWYLLSACYNFFRFYICVFYFHCG